MTNKSTTIKDEDNVRKINGDTPNVTNLMFPRDETGLSSMLRKEGVRAAGRIYGKKANLQTFLETLQVLAEHAKAKYKHDLRERETAIAAAKNRAAAAELVALADQKREAKRLREVADSAAAAVEAQEKGMKSGGN